MRTAASPRSPLPAALALLLLLAAGCPADERGRADAPTPAPERLAWAIAIHGGAGAPDRSLPEAERNAYLGGLGRALKLGADVLASGGTSLDAVERVVRDLEDDPLFNAGRGAVLNREGAAELDASIMDGATLACGAVGAVRTVRNPVTLARLVMERTEHVLLVGAGAERFAEAQGLAPEAPAYFVTERRWLELERALGADRPPGGGTVGAVALDRHGNLAAATSTGGRTGKLAGRVGDSPIVGAGTWAENATCAVSGTGKGEEFIRHGIARAIAARIRYRGVPVEVAAREVVGELLREGDGGVIAIDPAGRTTWVYNTPGMFRGAADATGRFEVHIWE